MDDIAQSEFRGGEVIIMDAKANGVGILMVTHDFATALQLGGNMLVMKEGRIIESGEVQFVFDHTTEPYTKSLIEAYSLSCVFTKGAES